jgi:predicted NAD/FAD-binding protein
MKIAVIGTGIAGNVAAARLCREHDITVFEASDHVGGHTHTHTIDDNGRPLAIDTGFIVFNDWTYPNFIALLDELGVPSQPSEMSFGVKCEQTGLEYKGHSLNTLFAQRRNLLRPSFHRMLRDILRFNREAAILLEADDQTLTLGDYLHDNHYSAAFRDYYILPMGAAIWSAEPRRMLAFPAVNFLRFFANHGLLNIRNRPQWRVIRGGSRTYVDRLTAPFRRKIRLNSPVTGIRRQATHVEISSARDGVERFDRVFIACHSDQALAMLRDASPLEREILGAIPYQRNDVVLHTDTSLLPRRRLAWSAWNYHRLAGDNAGVAVTYNMNLLQGLQTQQTFLVTLNNSAAIDPDRVITRLSYDHPVFTRAGIAAQQRQAEINGVNRSYFCGAYWRYGFHEDGVVSALNAIANFREKDGEQQLPLRRAG